MCELLSWRSLPKLLGQISNALIKGRRHERLIAEYGRWIISRGFKASTSRHPMDLVLRKRSTEWLVEGKVLVQGNATDAVRAAIGQLFVYRHFYFRGGKAPELIALFSEPIGSAYVELLTACEIASVWKHEGGWTGSKRAFEDGLSGATG